MSLLLAAPAHAQNGPSQIDRDAARTLVQQGDERREEGDFKAALEAYRRADDIMGVPTTAIEVGRMHQELGELVNAYEAYKRAAGHRQKDGEPEPFTAARNEARKLARELKARIPKIELDIEGVAPDVEVEVTIDDEIVEAWGRPFRIDPGAHEVVVRAKGYEDHGDTFVLDEGSSRTLSIQMEATAGDDTTLEPKEDGDLWPLAIAGFSVAGVGVVVGAITGGLALGDASTLNDNCGDDNSCPESERATLDRHRSLSHTSTASFAIAGVGAALGVVGLVLSLDGGDEADDVSTALTVGPSSVQFRLRF